MFKFWWQWWQHWPRLFPILFEWIWNGLQPGNKYRIQPTRLSRANMIHIVFNSDVWWQWWQHWPRLFPIIFEWIWNGLQPGNKYRIQPTRLLLFYCISMSPSALKNLCHRNLPFELPIGYCVGMSPLALKNCLIKIFHMNFKYDIVLACLHQH